MNGVPPARVAEAIVARQMALAQIAAAYDRAGRHEAAARLRAAALQVGGLSSLDGLDAELSRLVVPTASALAAPQSLAASAPGNVPDPPSRGPPMTLILLADFLHMLGWGCFLFVMMVGWAASAAAKAVGSVFQSDAVKDAATDIVADAAEEAARSWLEDWFS